MTLAHIQVYSSVIPEYFYDFPEGTERSVVGSIHFRPGTVYLTEGELKHIETSPKFAHLKGKFTVVSRPSEELPVPPAGVTEPSPVDALGDTLAPEKKSKFRAP